METNVPASSGTSGTGVPEKYVRTFAGDMETFKKGGTPDLVPLTSATHEDTATRAPAIPLPPSAPVPAPAKNPPPALPHAYVPPPVANAPIKTYSSDFTERMKGLHASTATVLAAEQDSAPIVAGASVPATHSRRSLFSVIAGVILLVAGIAGATVAYLRYETANAPVIPVLGVSAPIFVDNREQIAGSGSALLLSIEKSLVRPLSSGVIRLLYTENGGATSLFASLPLSAPGALLRNTIAEGSMAGIIRKSGVQTPFFILAVSSYSNTFGSMLSWEKTMPHDLSVLFPSYAAVTSVAPSSSATTTATTSTSSAQTAQSRAGFVDAVVANHDVRVYRDTASRDVIVYGYWNQTTLVIARDSAAFAEILGRLASSRAQN